MFLLSAIIIGFILAIITFIRSIESVTENEKIKNHIKSLHSLFSNYTFSFTNSTFEDVRKKEFSTLINTFILITFCIYTLFVFIQIVFEKINGVKSEFFRNDYNIILVLIIVLFIIQWGLSHNFLEKKNEILDWLQKNIFSFKSIKTYSILYTVLLFIGIIKTKSFTSPINLSNQLNEIIGTKFEQYLYLTPILLILAFVLIVVIIRFSIWFIFYCIAFISYLILKYFFKLCQYINSEKPLLPLVLIIQIIIIILSPIIALFIKFFLQN